MTTATMTVPRRNWWTIGLWVAQTLLAVAYLSAGSMKLFLPMDALVSMGLRYVTTMPELFIRFVGLMEILGATGLILPSLTRILPVLTLAAAVGLSVVQVAAIILHATRGETAMSLPVNLVLLALSLFIVWGRTKKARIASRG
ncbi:DoxX family protein [Azospirillum sp.]|uniref:DoxX family protein n=1 Tax=Azospirillum sp. TaxID=34012 RepID=UPI002D3AB09F|nr:DoxX family protein [Azospirillum sp.]HYD70413.1 DoxX family protein [Azospirillum sp.]